MKIYKFYPGDKTSFHFGDRNGKLKEILSSDQLYSAVYNCALLLYGQDEDKNPVVKSLQSLTLSSLFHGIRFLNQNDGKTKELFFLPRPLAPVVSGSKDKDLLNSKREKKIKYFSLGALKLLLESWNSEKKLFKFNIFDLEIMGEKYACTKEEIQPLEIDKSQMPDFKFFASSSEPKVVVSRLNDNSDNFYYQDKTEVNYLNIGNYVVSPFFYFICPEKVDYRLTAVIRLMADEGLSGKRSKGMGALGKVDEEEWPDELISGSGSYYMCLSGVFPTPDEAEKLVYYELAERSGYIYSQYGRPLRKKRLRLIKEGSIFSEKVSGQIIDVSPDSFNEHKVYLNGKALLVPFGRYEHEF
ncbi:MAG TPA: type III-A CRISPR-associated RAMP protein Csm4 [Clostridiaceae bacterium]|nr:type III-A CRISPR-associated RAMP protein Csm4 [Clostridiaceae bacterium]